MRANNETKRDRAAEEPNLFDKLAKVLDENNMQVTFTGWKAELEATEKKLASRDAEVQALREENERLTAFIIKMKNSSQCGATVLVAGQVLAGHDVRADSEPKDTSGGGT